MTDFYKEESTHVQMSEQELFEALVDLMTIQLSTADQISALKKAQKFNKKTNPGGIPSEDVALVAGAAKLEAAANYEEYSEKTYALKTKFEELTGYNV